MEEVNQNNQRIIKGLQQARPPSQERSSVNSMRLVTLRERVKVIMIMLNGLDWRASAEQERMMETVQEGRNQHLLLGALNIY